MKSHFLTPCYVLYLLTLTVATHADDKITRGHAEIHGETSERFDEAARGKWREALFDLGTDDWEANWFLDGEVGTVKTGVDGMELAAGPLFKNDAHHMVLWTRKSFAGDLKIEFEYTRLDNETRCVNILYIQATGSGKGPFARDIAKWSRLRRIPSMRTYYDNIHAYHISYAAYPNNDDTTAYIRARRYMPEFNSLKGTELKPEYFPKRLFKTGVPHKVTVIKRARELMMRIENAEQTYFCWMQNPNLPEIHDGRIGLRHMFTRSARYKNIRISTIQGDAPSPKP